MKRRQFLSLTGSAVGAVLLSRCANPSSQAKSEASSLSPSAYASEGGLLELDLDAHAQSIPIDGQSANLLSYGGRIPGPLLEVRPGDTVRIHFTNHRPTTSANLHGQRH